MVENERREQILKAEAAIRTLAETMAENLASKAEATQAASVLKGASSALDEANRTLYASSLRILDMQKAFDDARNEWRRTLIDLADSQQASREATKALRTGGQEVISDLRRSRTELDKTIQEMVSRNAAILADGLSALQRELEQFRKQQVAKSEVSRARLTRLRWGGTLSVGLLVAVLWGSAFR
jgi:hypothetical protein